MDTITRSRSVSYRQMLAGLLLAALLPTAAAQTVVVAPTRLTFEPGERSGQLAVINKSNRPMTVRISLENRRMLEDGRIVPAEQAQEGEQFADRLIQYAPRRVRLAPGESQTVRVLARRPSELAPGEYRSHLIFQAEPPAPSAQRGGDSDNRRLSVNLTPVFGVSIPVIVRTGELRATASISGLTLVPPTANEPPRVAFRLHRSGNRSVYGDVRVLFAPRGARQRVLTQARGIAVYTPNASRTVALALGDAGKPLSRGRLRVEYVAHDNPEKVLADAELDLP